MKSITIRNVPDEDYRALRVRAAQNGRSMEAELRALIERARAAEPKRARVWRTPDTGDIARIVKDIQDETAKIIPPGAPWSEIDALIAERRAEAKREADGN
jgi:plasmid stability protein